MGKTQITELVPQETIDKIKELDSELKTLLDTYTGIAKELAKGIDVKVKVIGDIDKLETLLTDKTREAASANERLNSVMKQQRDIIADTSNTISRQLMEQERVNKTQRESYTEYDKVRRMLEQFNATYEDQLRQFIKVEAEIKSYNKQLSDNEKKLKSGLMSQEAYKQAQLDITAAVRGLKQEKALLNNLMTKEEKANLSTEDSYRHLSQQLEMLKNAYKELSAEGRESEVGRELESTIQNLDAHLKDVAADMGEFQRNVGNYAIASGSVKKELKELVLEIANLSVAYARLSEEEQNSADGQALRSHIQQLTEDAGELKDAIADTNAAITNAASDTRTFDQVSEGIQVAIDGFGLLTGAAEMLGISESELAEVQTKLQAAIAASNAMQSIQASLQKQSALMQAANLVQTRLRTTAENIHTAAQGKGVVATTAATAAQWAFNAAANANPIGLVVVAIVACVAAVWGLVKAFNAFFGPSDEMVRKYEQQKSAIDETTEANKRYVDELKAVGAVQAEIHDTELRNKQEELEAIERLVEYAKKAYGEDSDEYKEAVEQKKAAEDDFTQSKEDALNYLRGVIHDSEEEEKKQRLGTYEYKRQLILAELEQQKALAATLLAQEKITREVYQNMVKALDKAAGMKIDKVNLEESNASSRKSSGTSRADGAKKEADELKKAVQAGEDALLNIISDSLERQRAAENLSYERRRAEINEKLAKTNSRQVELRSALHAQLEGLEAGHRNRLAEIEQAGIERRQKAEADFIASHIAALKDGSAEELEWKKKQLDNERDQELTEINKRVADRTLTEEQALEMRANLVEEYARKELEIEEEYNDKKIQACQERYAREQEDRNNAMLAELNDAQRQYAKELEFAGKNAGKRAAAKEVYEAKCARINERYAIESAEASVRMIEDQLSAEGLSADKREELYRKLANAKIALEKAVTEAVINGINERTKAEEDADGRRNESIRNWMQLASDALNQINDLAGAIYDAKIQRLEKEQEAEQEASDNEQARITELVEKKVITEEEGEARKRAAEAQTAKKNEEFERKKAALKRKEALWDKTNSIAQVGISTALAIMNMWHTAPWPVNLAMAALAGVTGAMQLATIAATPIPQYAKGTDCHKGGPAIVGDGGRQEVVVFNGSAWLTPDTPTLVDIPKGASVLPSVEQLQDGLVNYVIAPDNLYAKPSPVRPYDDTEIRRGIRELACLFRMNMQMQKEYERDRNLEIFKMQKL